MAMSFISLAVDDGNYVRCRLEFGNSRCSVHVMLPQVTFAGRAITQGLFWAWADNWHQSNLWRKKVRHLLIVFLLLLGSMTSVMAQLSIGIGIGLPGVSIGINLRRIRNWSGCRATRSTTRRV